MLKTLVTGCVLIASISFSGCVANGTNISKAGKVTIERIPSEKVRIPWADAFQDRSNLIKGIKWTRFKLTAKIGCPPSLKLRRVKAK